MNFGHSESRCAQLFDIKYSSPPRAVHSITYQPASQKLWEIKLNHIDPLCSTKLSANPVTSESEYTKGWTNEESWFYYRQGKNIALPQFARPVLRPTQSRLHWLMEISGRRMKLTAHLNLAPRTRVHGTISPLIRRPSSIVQELYLFLHFIWRTLPLLVLQVT
jgi:hypothetical protein